MLPITLFFTDIIRTYEWLVCWLLKATSEKLQKNLDKHGDSFTAKNESQVYYARTLAIAFIERFVIVKFLEKATSPEIGPEMNNVLLKVCSLYGTWALEQHISILYQGYLIFCYHY